MTDVCGSQEETDTDEPMFEDDVSDRVFYDDKQLVSTRNYKVGYEVRRELHRYGYANKDGSPPEWFEMNSAYTPNGDYIGPSKLGYHLVGKRGIKPELRTLHSNVCSIGFCEREQKWYGWSHRAMYGFGVGAVCSEGDVIASSGWVEEYLAEHPEADVSIPIGAVAKTLDEARKFACAFAEGVS